MSIGTIFLLAAVGFVSLLIVIKLSALERSDPRIKPVRGDELAIWPFAPIPIMTETEVLFFNKLKAALPEYHIFVQVQLSRLIEPNTHETSERSFWFNRICRQSVDYVITDIDMQTTLVAIELDDWTHNNRARQKADDKKDKALASAGIAVVRFDAERMPSAELIRDDVLQVIASYYA